MARDHDHAFAMRELLGTNRKLREALILAGKEIVKLNPGKRNAPVLNRMRRALRESRAVTKGIILG